MKYCYDEYDVAYAAGVLITTLRKDVKEGSVILTSFKSVINYCLLKQTVHLIHRLVDEVAGEKKGASK